MDQGRYSRRGTAPVVVLALAGLALMGCEVHTFLDPSVPGRWERTPLVLPILDKLDVIDEPSSEPMGLTQVRPEDLIGSVQEYIVSPGDIVTLSVYELFQVGVDSVHTRRVDELGMIRIPEVGPIKAEGLTPSQLEAKVADILQTKGKLKDPLVSVIVQESRGNTFSVIAEPVSGGTRSGTFNIISKDFRLLDAVALAGGVPGSIKKIYVMRQASLTKERVEGPIPPAEEGSKGKAPAPASGQPTTRPADLIQDLVGGLEPGDAPRPRPANPPGPPAPAPGSAAPTPRSPVAAPAPGLEAALEPSEPANRWIEVDGKWTYTGPSRPAGQPDEQQVVAQRIIDIPFDRLLEGDSRYNIVIRPGDVIRVPGITVGNVYIGNYVNRPGTYQLPGDRDLTLKQLIFAAGNFSALAIPERVDLIRRIGRNQEAVVRLNMRAIFEGTEPDIFLKPNDTINVGTNFMAYPLAIFRNGLRMSYGFGFVLDRNFADDVFGPAGR